MKILIKPECSFTAAAEREIVWDVRESLCCVGLDYDTQLKSTAESCDKETTCELPEGNIKVVGAERFCSVAFCSSPVPLVKKPVGSTTPLGKAS